VTVAVRDQTDYLYPLVGRRGLVTGAGSSIGRAIALELGAAGAFVGVCYRQNEVGAERVVAEIDAHGGQAVALELDVRTPVIEFNADFLVNNAAITAGRSVAKTTREDWQRVLDVNLTGAFMMTQAVVPYMLEQGYGRIVNIASVVGLDGRLGPSSYAASKAGLVGFTKAAALELAHKGITVNAIAPGFIDDTGLLGQVPESLRQDVLQRIPMRRFGRVEDVARAALYLIAFGDYVTGTVLNVSGGWHT
jgi:NAD(P)-dependent dehydrogenase (short-subunit alcohol dehydrogenase family)